MSRIKEVIVVEGRDDITAVKRAVDAEMLAVSGFGINAAAIEKIKEAQKRCGVIVFMDPDYAGEKIRRIISKRVPGIKHAYIGRDEGTKGDNIGVENASPEAILKALDKAKFEVAEAREFFNIEDMMYFGLMGKPNSKELRQKIGKELGIGYGNTTQFVAKLNNYGISKEEFVEAFEKIKGDS